MVDKPRIRILAVADGTLTFNPGPSSSLDLALGTVLESDHYRFEIENHHMSKGHLPELEGFHQLWLFGHKHKGTLKPRDRDAIVSFMDGGGGVFATGDHETIGRKLCGSIPRLEYMRSWEIDAVPKKFGFPKLGAHPTPSGGFDECRIDTRTPETLFARRRESEDQDRERDCIPKRIEARLRLKTAPPLPHPVLRMSDDAPLRVLPDHIHEGVCFDLESTDEEIPGFEHHKPEVIADTYTYTGSFDGESYVYSSRQYGVVSVYDPPKRVGSGRIVVDSTFHHWMEQNVRPFFEAKDTSCESKKIWESLKQYYVNVANWLVPRPIRARLLEGYIKHIIAHTDVNNAMAALSKNKSDRVLLAREVLGELDRTYRRSVVSELVEDMLADSDKEAELHEIFVKEVAAIGMNSQAMARAVSEAHIVAVVSDVLANIANAPESESPTKRALQSVQESVRSLATALNMD